MPVVFRVLEKPTSTPIKFIGFAIPNLQSGDVTAGARDFVEEGAELGGIFFAGAEFDATGHIDGVGADDADGFGDVFGSESAGEDDALGLRSGAREVPVAGCAAAAVVAGESGVQQKGGGAAKAGKIRRGTSLPQAQGLDDRQTAGDAIDNLLRFVAVELRGGKTEGFAKRYDRRLRPVDKDADGGDERRKSADQFGGCERRDAARAGVVKIQADGVSTEVGGEFGVFQLGDATDFDADHGKYLTGRRGATGLLWGSEQLEESRGGVGSQHEVFAD